MKLERIEAIISTGLPGLYRVIVFLAIQITFNSSQLGNIASSFTTAQILGFFSAIGWSSILLTRLPRLSSKEQKNEELNRILIMALATALLIVIILVQLALLTGNLYGAFEISSLLIGWTVYQIPRHYLIAEKLYRKAIFLDILLLSITTLSISISTSEIGVVASISSSLAICGAALYFHLQKGAFGNITKLKFEKIGLEFGLANFITGGIALSIIPASKAFSDPEVTGLLSLFLSISSISWLIPRALSLNNLPALTIELNERKHSSLILQELKRQITTANIATTIACIFLIALFYLYSPGGKSTTFLVLSSILTLQGTLTTQSIINSNILMCLEKSKSSLKISGITFVIYITLSILAVSTLPKEHKITGIVLALTISTAIRLIHLGKISGKLLCQQPFST